MAQSTHCYPRFGLWRLWAWVPDAGEGVEVVVEGVGDGGAQEMCALENECDLWSFCSDGPQVANIGEVTPQKAGRAEGRGWEFRITFEGGPFVELLAAALNFDPAAQIVAQDDVEAREQNLGEEFAEAAEAGGVYG